MIAARAFAGRHVAVFGLGASGLAAARALAAGGAHVHAWDDGEPARERAAAEGVALDDLNMRDWSQFAALVLAPGVPLTHPEPHRVVELARMTGTPIIGDIELFARALGEVTPQLRPRVIGVTGTNGKSTTTALIGHILKAAGRDARVGGNIGEPALNLPDFHAGAIYVLELSSFQLDLTSSLRPDVSVLLNIAPDHLDRHGSMERYVEAKKRLFANQGVREAAVIGVDDAKSQEIASELAAGVQAPRVVRVSSGRALGRGAHAVGGLLYDAIQGAAEEVVDLRAARALPGRHNWQNAAAAFAAARLMGVSARQIRDGLLSFPGLPHRLEEVARAGAVRFLNDSKATNVAAAKQALGAYENIFWIAGGRAKGESFAELAMFMPRVSRAFLIGEAAETIGSQLHGRAVIEISRDLKTAVAAASRAAAASGGPDPVVLLCPACASYDQFKNFEARGDAFRALAVEEAARMTRDLAS